MFPGLVSRAGRPHALDRVQGLGEYTAIVALLAVVATLAGDTVSDVFSNTGDGVGA